jgi:hypothetical protein
LVYFFKLQPIAIKMVVQLRSVIFQTILCLYFFKTVVSVSTALREKVPCIDNDKFYRNPNRDAAHIWSATLCSQYYLCVENEVFSFACSTGLNFVFEEALELWLPQLHHNCEQNP